MYIDSTFYTKLSELHKEKFDWSKNNCGFFVGKMLKHMYGKDFLSEYIDKCVDEKASWRLIFQKGGWHGVLSSAGFSKREDNAIYVGDVVIAENAIGIFDGNKALFAGGAFRDRNKITSVYYYTEK
jgi:hypothetical protein